MLSFDDRFYGIMEQLRSTDVLDRENALDFLRTDDNAYDMALRILVDDDSPSMDNILDRYTDEYRAQLNAYLFTSVYGKANKSDVGTDTYRMNNLDAIRQDIEDTAGHPIAFVNASDFMQFMDTHGDDIQYDHIFALIRDDLKKMVVYSLLKEEPLCTDTEMHGDSTYSDTLTGVWQQVYAKADSILSDQSLGSHISDAEDLGMYSLDNDF